MVGTCLNAKWPILRERQWTKILVYFRALLSPGKIEFSPKIGRVRVNLATLFYQRRSPLVL